MTDKAPFIKLDHVSVIYPNGLSAIDDISFTLQPGRICGLVGVNGAGKSTLFKTMMGFLRPTRGTVEIMGGPVRDALKRSLIAYVPQTEDVDWNFPVLVEDVVMMGRYGHMGLMRRPSAEDRQAVEDALRRVNMLDFRKRQIGELSGGQKKRIFVARTLAQGGKILFLDEPFTGIDVKTENTLTQLFRELAAEGRLILVSTHNLGSVPSFCDDVILINRKLIATGPVDIAFTQENLTEAFGGMLRHIHVGGGDLHDDEDRRLVTVLTDDERPVVLYGEAGGQKIMQPAKDKT
jgi:manganese/iron transport system ATP-binding protein